MIILSRLPFTSVAFFIALAFFIPATSLAAPALWEVHNATELFSAAEQCNSPGGGTIYLAPGVYVIDKTIAFRNVHHVNIHGSGWNTSIVRQGAGDAISFEDCSFAVLRDLHIAGHAKSATGSAIVYTGYSSSNAIETCRMENFRDSGVRYEGGPAKPMSSNSIRNCHFIGNRGDQLWSYCNNDFYIIGNQFGAFWLDGVYEPSRTGAVLDHSSAGTYSMNYHWGNMVALRLQPGSHFNRFENNRFEESREYGILIGDASKSEGLYFNLFTGNTIHTNSQSASGKFPALLAYNAANVTFTSNQVFSWDNKTYKHKAGLELGKGCEKWIIKDNQFAHQTGPAVIYDASAGHIVKDNIAE